MRSLGEVKTNQTHLFNLTCNRPTIEWPSFTNTVKVRLGQVRWCSLSYTSTSRQWLRATVMTQQRNNRHRLYVRFVDLLISQSFLKMICTAHNLAFLGRNSRRSWQCMHILFIKSLRLFPNDKHLGSWFLWLNSLYTLIIRHLKQD